MRRYRPTLSLRLPQTVSEQTYNARRDFLPVLYATRILYDAYRHHQPSRRQKEVSASHSQNHIALSCVTDRIAWKWNIRVYKIVIE